MIRIPTLDKWGAMVILGRPQLKFFGFAMKKYINVLQQVSGRK